MTKLWRGVDYKLYIMYNEDGKMTPRKQPYFNDRKLLFFADSFRSAGIYALDYPKPTILEFNNLDYDFYEIKQMNTFPFYYYTEKSVSINGVNIVYTLKRTPEVERLLNTMKKTDIVEWKNHEKYWNRKVIK